MTLERMETGRVAPAGAARQDDAERLILAAGGGAREVRRAVAGLGLPRVAAVLLDELAFRCAAGRSVHPVRVLVRLRDGDGWTEAALRFAQGLPVRVDAVRIDTGPADAGEAPDVLRFDFAAADLVRAMFGPSADGVPHPGRSEQLAPLDGPEGSMDLDWGLLGAASLAADQLLAACSSRPPDLGALALANGSDKWGVLHRFTPHYDHHLRRLRNEAVRVLEIGVGGYAFMPGGGSLKMWKRYFHRGQIFGTDIFDKSHADELRVKTLVADQNDPDQMRRLAVEHGPFDVVIDDGSHVNGHVRTAFHTLFPHLNAGGVYVIEDLWTAFCPGFGGEDARRPGPGTSLDLVKELVDSIQYEEWRGGAGEDAASVAATAVGLHVHHNIAFIEKGVNGEGGVPRWVPRSFDALVDIDTPPTRWSGTR